MNMSDIRGTLWETLEENEQPARASHARRDAQLPVLVQARLRAAYFADAREVAMRYRVSVGEMIAHLEGAGLARMPRPERAVDNVRCAVHAAALVRGEVQAWTDLLNALAPGFDRACAARLDPRRGIAFARRFWIALRVGTLGEAAARLPGPRTGGASELPRGGSFRSADLRSFAATRPMRYWLAERLLGSLETELGRAASDAERLDTAAQARTLRIPALTGSGREARA